LTAVLLLILLLCFVYKALKQHRQKDTSETAYDIYNKYSYEQETN
jgi:hypothetical protein